MTRKPQHTKGISQPSLTSDIVTPTSSQALFWQADFLDDDPVVVHLPFLFWLTEISSPRAMITIGGRSGVAHFGFCQSANKLTQGAMCYHIGEWDNATIPNTLQTYSDMHFEGYSKLLAGSAQDAIALFPDETIDLIFIDQAPSAGGRADLLAALRPKLSDQGLLLIHGANGEADADHAALNGSGRFTLEAGAGLDVYAIGDSSAEPLQHLFTLALGQSGYADIQRMFNRLGKSMLLEAGQYAQTEKLRQTEAALSDLTQGQAAAEAAKTQLIAEKAALQTAFAEQSDRLAVLQDKLSGLTETLGQKQSGMEATAKSLLAKIEAQHNDFLKLETESRKNITLRSDNLALKEQLTKAVQAQLSADQEIATLQQALGTAATQEPPQTPDSAAEEALFSDEVAEFEKKNAALEAKLARRDAELAQMTRALEQSRIAAGSADQDTQTDLTDSLRQRYQEITQLTRRLEQREFDLNQLNDELALRHKERDALVGRLRDLEAVETDLRAQTVHLTATVNAQTAQIAEQNTAIMQQQDYIAAQQGDYGQLQEQKQLLVAQIEEVMQSTSWKITEPVRKILNRARGN